MRPPSVVTVAPPSLAYVTDVPMVLVDQDRTSASRALVEAFLSSGYFDLVGAQDTTRDLDRWFLTGQAQMALVIGRGYGEAVESWRTPSVQVIADDPKMSEALRQKARDVLKAKRS